MGARTRQQQPERKLVHHEAIEVRTYLSTPVHINNLVVEYERQGFQILSQSKAANISVHLSAWEDLSSLREVCTHVTPM